MMFVVIYTVWVSWANACEFKTSVLENDLRSAAPKKTMSEK